MDSFQTFWFTFLFVFGTLLCLNELVTISKKIDAIECQHVNAWQIPESLIEDTQFPKPTVKPIK